MPTLDEIGEHEAISKLVRKLGNHRDLIVGPGDDCAVCRMPGGERDQIFTTDPIVEGVHFLSGEQPERVGHKAAGRVLSDIAAMGAEPQWVLVNVVCPPETEAAQLERMYDGMNALCHQFGATVIGGDLAKGPVLELHLFGSGTLPADTALLRSAAQPGDRIVVTGPLGGSLAGHHLDFIPRVAEGIFLRESGLVHAMMDISDGLATDLRHILSQSACGAVLDEDLIPKNETLEQALFDGEDFELLLTVPESAMDALFSNWKRKFSQDLYEIGVIDTEVGRLRLKRGSGIEILDEKAFEHFKSEHLGE